jgi:Flp pilus assembly protein TadD
MLGRVARTLSAAACLFGADALSTAACTTNAHAPEAARIHVAHLRDRARLLLDLGQAGEAIEVAERAAQLAPDDATSWLLLASMHVVAGHADQACSTFAACVGRASGESVVQCRERLC